MSGSPSPLHRSTVHESARQHVTGAARYIDELPMPSGGLLAYVVQSPVARGQIRQITVDAARRVPGVHAILLAGDVPGRNKIGAIEHDEDLLAADQLFAVGQSVALIVGESLAACRAAERLIVLDIEELPAILTIPQAIAEDSWLTAPHVIERGEVEVALSASDLVIEGTLNSGGQDHFYLETQSAFALPGEAGTIRVLSSTQHPSEVQAEVAAVLGVRRNQVVVETPRLGGAFGGKESQASPFACLAALAASKLRRPVKLWLNREQDMDSTGKRHPFHSRYRAGFDEKLRLRALDAQLFANGGWSVDLSGPIMDRALFHLDNAYFIEHLRFEGRACRTNLPSNTAFRGFGGPQGMLVVEDAIARAAERRGVDPLQIRESSLYGEAPRNIAPYGEPVDDNRLRRILGELKESSQYAERRTAIEDFNAAHRFTKRGIGLQPIKFGISFTNSVLNQAGALVQIYSDGSVQLNHGGTEMGQGLHTKMRAICAHELGISADEVRVMHTATDKVPNTVATAASSGSDLNGQAVQQACGRLRTRMRSVAAMMLDLDEGEAWRLDFSGGLVTAPGRSALPFAEVANQCFVRQVSLSSTGYYRTPEIAYDRDAGRGRPFHYFAFGAAVVEVELSGLSGEHRLRRVDILHDAGSSLVPAIDVGQVEGGFLQGYGWLTCEEVLYDERGHLLTNCPSTYKIPAFGDAPRDFRVKLLDRARQGNTIHGSKAVGEPPFMLALAVITALRHGIASFGAPGLEVELGIPCTPESILRAIEDLQSAPAESGSFAAMADGPL